MNFTKLIKPVEFDQFLYYLELYHAAADRKTPVENPASRGFMFPDIDGVDRVYSFTDIPVNRGLMAVFSDIDNKELSFSVGMRVISLRDVLDKKRFEQYYDIGTGDDSEIGISESLLYGVARAKFKKNGGLNLNDVSRLARHYDKIHGDND